MGKIFEYKIRLTAQKDNDGDDTMSGSESDHIIRELKEIQIAECFLRGMLDGATFWARDNNYFPTEKLEYHHLIDIIYKVEWLKDFDPIAIVQCACCHLEKVLGIFPNVDKLETGSP